VALIAAALVNFWQAQNMGTVLFGLFAPAVIVALMAAFARSEAPLTRNLALFGMLLAGAMALGHYRVGDSRLGLLLPLPLVALTVPAYIVLSYVAGRRGLGQANWLVAVVHAAGVAVLLVVGLFIVQAVLGLKAEDKSPLPALWALGLLVGLVVWWLAHWLAVGERGRAGPEGMVALAVLIGLGLAVAYGRGAGFGVGLFALGAFAWLALAAEGDLAGVRRGTERPPDEGTPAQDRLARVTHTTQVGAAFATLFLLVRCAAERADWGGATLDPRDAWRFFGMLAGMLLPLATVSLARQESAARPVWRHVHAAWLVALLIGLTGLMAFFWRADTLVGLLGGFALAAFMALLLQWRQISSFLPGGLAALLCAVTAVHFVPRIHEATGGEGRLARVLLLLGAALVAGAISAVLAALSGRGPGRE
jgi:hypothetical protein